MAPTTRSSTKMLAAIATTAVVAMLAILGLAHVSDVATNVHKHIHHHRTLRQLQAAQAYELVFHAKRDSMKIHGHADFTVLVQPVADADADVQASSTSSAFEFNGVATFVDGETTHVYSLVNGVAYYSQNESSGAVVVPTSELPPLHQLIEALETATPLDSLQTTQTIDCPASSPLFHARFADQDFALCSVDSGVKAFGEDFNVEIRATTQSQAEITAPATIVGSAASAVDVSISSSSISSASASASSVVPRSTRRLSAAASMADVLKRAASDSVSRISSATASRTLELQASSCGCKSKPRPCIFFHGMDIKADGGLVDNFDFFGDIKNHAPCCSSIKFAVLNTVDYAWNNASLVDKACGYALSMSNTSDLATGTIEDTIVVAHSMGNLMLAHAEATGKCKLGASSSWVALSGPFTGSMGSDFQQQICEGQYFAHEIVAGVVALFGQCPQSKARQALTYQNGNFSSAALNAQYVAAQAVHQKRVTAGVCGYTSNGLLSGDLLGLVLGGNILPHKSKENDGVVEFQSCIATKPATATYAETWSSQFYRAKLNHADTTFKNGDAWLDNQKKPVKWFECLPL